MVFVSYEPVTIREAAQVEVLLFVALAFVGALAIIYWGFQTYRFGRVISDTPPEPVRSVAMGRTEVNGQILPYQRVYDQPFTEGRCVYGEYKVREYKEYPNDDDKDDRWETVDSGSFGCPFYIDDETGKILVEPNDDTIYEISDEYSNTIRVGKNQSPPGTVQNFLGGTSTATTSHSSDDENANSGRLGRLRRRFFGGDGGEQSNVTEQSFPDTQPNHGTTEEESEEDETEQANEYRHVRRSELSSASGTSRKRRYIQTVLPVEGETYVYGGATRRDPEDVSAGDVAEVIRTDPSTGEFIISDKSEFELARGYTKRSVMYMTAGLVCGAMILAVLAQILITGPLYGIEATLP